MQDMRAKNHTLPGVVFVFSLDLEALAVDLCRVCDKGKGVWVGLLDEPQDLRKAVAARNGDDDLLFPVRIAALRAHERRAAVSALVEHAGYLVSALRHGVDDLGIVYALRDGVDELGNDEDRNDRIHGDLDIAEHQHRKGDDRGIDAEHQRACADIREEFPQQQGKKVRSARADAPLEQHARAEPDKRAARDGSQQSVAGIARRQRSEEVGKRGEQTRGNERHDERVAAEQLPRRQQQRKVQYHHPCADADGRHDLRQRRSKAGNAARRNIVRYIENGDGRRHQRAADHNADRVPQRTVKVAFRFFVAHPVLPAGSAWEAAQRISR